MKATFKCKEIRVVSDEMIAVDYYCLEKLPESMLPDRHTIYDDIQFQDGYKLGDMLEIEWRQLNG